MKKFKQWVISHKVASIVIAVAFVACVTLAIVLPIVLSHKHTFNEAWSVDSAYHWHACDEKDCNGAKDKGKHDFDADRKCKVCQKTEFKLVLDIEENVSADTGTFQSYWIVEYPDAEYLDTGLYGYEYFKYSADGKTLTSIGDRFPTTAGNYKVKVVFDGDKTYLPAVITETFTIVE